MYPNRYGIKQRLELTLIMTNNTTEWMLFGITFHCFPRLCKIVMLVLLILHFNAQEEHIFSMVHKNKTAFQPNLDPKGTSSSILTVKLPNDMPAHRFEPTKDLLNTAKHATWNYNKEHLSKYSLLKCEL